MARRSLIEKIDQFLAELVDARRVLRSRPRTVQTDIDMINKQIDHALDRRNRAMLADTFEQIEEGIEADHGPVQIPPPYPPEEIKK